ncbi:MAG: hypothetical protein R2730_12300 [Chitinophagales bacterium]
MLQNKWFQHGIAILTFLIVALLFCRPVLEGKILMASDNFQTIGSLHEADKIVADGDAKIVGWTGYMFSGMPVYRGNVPNKLVGLVYALGNRGHAHSYDLLLWLMVSFYILCMAMGLNVWVSMGISIAFAFTGFNIMSMEGGHFQKTFALAMVPGTLAGLIFLLRGNLLAGAATLILFMNLLTGVNHTQITYYAVIVSFITFLFFFVFNFKKHAASYWMKAAGVVVISLTLSVLANLGVFYTKVLAEATTRGGHSELSAKKDQGGGLERDYAGAWSMDGIEAFSYLIPNFAGGPSGHFFIQDQNSNTFKAFRKAQPKDANALAQKTSAYWGSQPFVGGGFYMGAGLSFLFILFLIFNRDYKRFWLGSLFVIVLLIALGKNFPAVFNFLFDHLPLYNKFRVPSMINLMMEIIIAAGAGLALHQIFNKEVDKTFATNVLIGVLASIVAFVLLAPMLFNFESRAGGAADLPGWLSEALRKDRIALMRKDAIRSIIIMALVGGLIWVYLQDKLKNKIVFALLIGAIISVDMIGNAGRHISAENFVTKRRAMSIFTPTPADQQILADPDIHYRVLNLTRSPFNDAITSYLHKSIGGYHGAKLRRYQELIEYQLAKNNRAVINMLNTKYYITQGQNGQPQAQRNPGAAGNAWLVDSLAVVQNGDEEMNGLNAPFDPKKYAVIQEEYIESGQPRTFNSAGSSISLLEYSPDKMTYKANLTADGFAVFSEIFYELDNGDGWHAYIDGKEADVKKVNFTLRGLYVPAGEHDIIFEFKKDKVIAINKIRVLFSIITGVVVLLIIAFSIWKGTKKEA